jgi:xylan 1,4-beta-xylosidase
MFGMMKGQRLKGEANQMYPLQQVLDSGIRAATDIGVFATADKKQAALMIWNYHDVDKTGDSSMVTITIDHIRSKNIQLSHYRIDATHSNSYEVWKKMGSPQNPSAAQIKTLEEAGQLQLLEKPTAMKVKEGKLQLQVSMPRC